MKKFIVGILIALSLVISYASPVLANDDDEQVHIPTAENDFIKKVFGEGLNLDILKPLNFWDMEGTASIWSLLATLFSIAFPILYIAFVASVLIGAMKWISSQGKEAQLQSAQKWIKNAVLGFVGTTVVFIAVNVITWWLGVGSIFNLAQNLAVCEKQVLYEFKQSNPEYYGSDYYCTCEEGAGWKCELAPVPEPEETEE